jgi:uncharacterized membrane protein
MSEEKQLVVIDAPKPESVHYQKTVHIQFAPRSLASRIVAVLIAVAIVVLAFFFLATAIVLAGILVAIGVGKLLWSSRKGESR